MNLPYHVYQKTRTGWRKLGEVLYEADARAILDKWGAGYIAHNGDIIFQKGF